jgi:hypothetical protein
VLRTASRDRAALRHPAALPEGALGERANIDKDRAEIHSQREKWIAIAELADDGAGNAPLPLSGR